MLPVSSSARAGTVAKLAHPLFNFFNLVGNDVDNTL